MIKDICVGEIVLDPWRGSADDYMLDVDFGEHIVWICGDLLAVEEFAQILKAYATSDKLRLSGD